MNVDNLNIKHRPKVLIVATSRKTRGGIASVINAYKSSRMWEDYHCKWISTHIDRSAFSKFFFFISSIITYCIILPYYDIVHIHCSLLNSTRRKYLFFLIARLYHKKTIVHLHCGDQLSDIWNWTYYDMFSKADKIITLSNVTKNVLVGYLGKDTGNKISILFNPCYEISNYVSYNNRKKIILYAATITSGKGYKDLLSAFGQIANKYSEWKLVIAGNGEVDNAIMIAQKLGIAGRVFFPGWINDDKKEYFFNSASVFCLPSYAEGFPMAVLDAFSYGLPVITTPVGGIPDVAIDGENMLLFNPGDIEGLSKQLVKLMDDEDLRNRLSNESIELSRTTFNLNNICGQLSKIYDNVSG